MQEINHDNLGYQGTPGETVTVTVEAKNTNKLVTYDLRKAGHVPVPPNGTFQFQLVAGDNVLIFLLDSNTNTGQYRVVIRPIENETNNECVHEWTYHGNPMEKDFVFSA